MKNRSKIYWIVFLVLIVLMSVVKASACIEPSASMVLTDDTSFCPGEFEIDGIAITVGGILVTCENTYFSGNSTAILLDGVSDVAINGCRFNHFKSGVYLKNSNDIHLSDLEFNSTEHGIYLHMSSNVSITGSKFTNVSYGVTVSGSSNVNINPIEVYDSNIGIYFSNSVFNKIEDSVFKNNTVGILCEDSEHLKSIHNKVSYSKKNGIHLVSCSDAVVENNQIIDCLWSGIVLENSQSTIRKNSIVNNRKTGIFISENSSKNIISKNLIKENWIYSIYIDASSADNVIMDNEIYKSDINDLGKNNEYCKDGTMNLYYEKSSGPGCLKSPIASVLNVSNTSKITEQPNVSSDVLDVVNVSKTRLDKTRSNKSLANVLDKVQKNVKNQQNSGITKEPILKSSELMMISESQIDPIIADVSKYLQKPESEIRSAYKSSVNKYRIEKTISTYESSEGNYTTVSIFIRPKTKLYNFSVYEQFARPVSGDIFSEDENFNEITDSIFYWDFPELSDKINLTYRVSRLLSQKPLTLAFSDDYKTSDLNVPDNNNIVVDMPDNEFNWLFTIISTIIIFGAIAAALILKSHWISPSAQYDEQLMQMVNYVRDQLHSGISAEEMRNYLLSSGYDQEFVQNIFSRLQ